MSRSFSFSLSSLISPVYIAECRSQVRQVQRCIKFFEIEIRDYAISFRLTPKTLDKTKWANGVCMCEYGVCVCVCAKQIETDTDKERKY